METNNLLPIHNANNTKCSLTKLWTIRLCSTMYFSLFQIFILAGYSSWQSILLSSIEITVPYLLLSIFLFPTPASSSVNRRWLILWLASWGVYWVNFLILFYLNPSRLEIYSNAPELYMELYPIIMLMFMGFPVYMIYSAVLPLLKVYFNNRKIRKHHHNMNLSTNQ